MNFILLVLLGPPKYVDHSTNVITQRLGQIKARHSICWNRLCNGFDHILVRGLADGCAVSFTQSTSCISLSLFAKGQKATLKLANCGCVQKLAQVRPKEMKRMQTNGHPQPTRAAHSIQRTRQTGFFFFVATSISKSSKNWDRAVARTAECSSGEQPGVSSRLAHLTSPTGVFSQLFSG